jgi:hypothetical protein
MQKEECSDVNGLVWYWRNPRHAFRAQNERWTKRFYGLRSFPSGSMKPYSDNNLTISGLRM